MQLLNQIVSTLTLLVAHSKVITKTTISAHGLVFLDNSSQFSVINCVFNNDLFNGKQEYGLFVGNGSSKFTLFGNNFEGNVQPLGALIGTITDANISGNIGGPTLKKQGTAKIDANAGEVEIQHGLLTTPPISAITVSRTSPPAESTAFWVSDANETSFKINAKPVPTLNTFYSYTIDLNS